MNDCIIQRDLYVTTHREPDGLCYSTQLRLWYMKGTPKETVLAELPPVPSGYKRYTSLESWDPIERRAEFSVTDRPVDLTGSA